MVLVDVDITSDPDDGFVVKSSGGIPGPYILVKSDSFMNAVLHTTGVNSGEENRAFVMFRGITIPQGANIDDATLNVDGETQKSGGQVITVSASNTQPTLPPNTGSALGGGAKVFTGSKVNATATYTVPNTTNTQPLAIDVQNIVQELVDNFDYSSDNMLFTIKTLVNAGTGTTSTAYFSQYNDGGAKIPNLTINYTATFKNFTVDAVLSFTTQITVSTLQLELANAPVKTFTVDALLKATNTKDFIVDAILAPSFVIFNFTIDASITGNTGVFLDVGDLILRVLFENPPSLTGLEIIEKIREITEVELQWGFFGKVSRIKNWIGFLERNGDIEEDDSDPDWYETQWSLV